MKILSYNIRGIGNSVKSKDVREFIRTHNIDVCCLQETKTESVKESLINSLFGGGKLGWIARDSIGRSGGILTMWNIEVFSAASY